MPNDRKHRFHPLTQARARALRKDDIPAEYKLWQRLRNRQLDGLKFRRNIPVGQYIADFLCHECQLIVELDGPSHERRFEHDRARTVWLEQQGFRVLRIINQEVHTDMDAVLKTIVRECGRVVD